MRFAFKDILPKEFNKGAYKKYRYVDHKWEKESHEMVKKEIFKSINRNQFWNDNLIKIWNINTILLKADRALNEERSFSDQYSIFLSLFILEYINIWFNLIEDNS